MRRATCGVPKLYYVWVVFTIKHVVSSHNLGKLKLLAWLDLLLR
jgi:hypothetical protein